MATKGRIIWVEDDTKRVLGIYDLVQPLRTAGYQIEVMESKKKVLSNLGHLRSCDLILLDIILPTGDNKEEGIERYTGLSILRAIREYGIDKPVLVLSVVSNPRVLDELHRLKVAGIVRKPVRPSVLKEHVETILGIDTPHTDD